MPYSIQVGWDDVPHLTEDAKEDLRGAYPPHELDARSKGIPILGSGRIYPVPDEVWQCEPFEIPEHWPRAYGMDVGWNRTAAIWGAWDRDSDTVYCYSEHYMGEEKPSIHADAIKARGYWVPGAIDPASKGRGQLDGKRLLEAYQELELILFKAENAVEAGLHSVLRRLSGQRLKIFRTLVSTAAELRLYRRDEKGKVVKQNDHLMDAMRYLIMTGLVYAATEPQEFDGDGYDREQAKHERSGTTGY